MATVEKYLNPDEKEEYKDNMISPDGWEKKLSVMRKGEIVYPYPSYDIFDEKETLPNEDNTKQCRILSVLKDVYCKTDHSYQCNRSTPFNLLPFNHNMLMKCRNICAIENQANCYYPDKQGWLTNNHGPHKIQIENVSKGALKCLTEYNNRIAGRRMIKQKSTRVKRRKSASHYKPKKRSASRTKSYSKRKSSRRK